MSKTHEDPGGPEYDKGLTMPGFSAAEIEGREHCRDALIGYFGTPPSSATTEIDFLVRERTQAEAAGAERMRLAVQDECMDLFNRFRHWPDVAQAYALMAGRISAKGFGMGIGNK